MNVETIGAIIGGVIGFAAFAMILWTIAEEIYKALRK